MAILEADPNKRQAARQPVLKGAKILFGDAVLDCLVHDISATGARISMAVAMVFPAELMIEMRSGGRWMADVRWQRGTETGLVFTRFAGLHGQAAVEASKAYARMRSSGVHDVLADLTAAKHFDHPALRDAALELERAVAGLQEALRVSAGLS